MRNPPVYTEQNVLNLLISGFDNREIARELHATEQEVQTAIGQLYARIGVRTRTEAVLDSLRGKSDSLS